MPENAPTATARIWVLADDRAGNRSQCLGVARALGLPFETKEIAYGPLVRLPNALLGASFAYLTPETRAALSPPPWPDLVIAAGRRSAPAARRIKRLSGGRTKLVQILHPGAGAGASDFDLIAQPAHDARSAAANAVVMHGAPHGLTPDVLAEAAREWEERFAHLPRPRIALVIGGSTRRRAFTQEMAADLGDRAAAMARQAGGSLLISTSRRLEQSADGPEVVEALTAAFADTDHHLYRWGDTGDNPYRGYLALADAVVVTGDSVSMCTEACARTGPVYIYAPDALITPKHKRFHDFLFESGYARPLAAGTRYEAWTHALLDPAAEVARAIRERLHLT